MTNVIIIILHELHYVAAAWFMRGWPSVPSPSSIRYVFIQLAIDSFEFTQANK